ncbi:MAG: hypothetical protein B7Z76_14850 [Acidiphilium sp. 20-67-58]|nr:MAG: hypothetical protein B7Z76_14850 [Acidiphilium sp. 20-67-58]
MSPRHPSPPSGKIQNRSRTTQKGADQFNNRRLLEPIGNIPPAEAEARYYEQLNELAMVA